MPYHSSARLLPKETGVLARHVWEEEGPSRDLCRLPKWWQAGYLGIAARVPSSN